MKQSGQTRACWNCEADVGHEATYCPFCAADLLTGSSEQSKKFQKQGGKFSDQSLQESLASLYKPPYSVRNRHGFGVPDEREETPYIETQTEKKDPLFQSYETNSPEEALSSRSEEGVALRSSVLPLLLVMIGSHLFVLGALLLFCSKGGVVTLEWSSRFWFLYCLISFPLLYFGGKMLKSQND